MHFFMSCRRVFAGHTHAGQDGLEGHRGRAEVDQYRADDRRRRREQRGPEGRTTQASVSPPVAQRHFFGSAFAFESSSKRNVFLPFLTVARSGVVMACLYTTGSTSHTLTFGGFEGGSFGSGGGTGS